MALPLIATSLGGMIISSLTLFFATRLPVILATLGLTAVVYKGIDVFLDQIVGAIQSAMVGGNIPIGNTVVDGLSILGAAGVWDAINIVLSGYAAVAAIKTAKVSIEALKK
ncbi:DUF2523 family protein [Azonexus sp. R2A61]|uniref:DUF2523 family protein n=1 Tax=Azonexus sp. R2A61 TaxID=2744443 RepID=UPI001F41220F|nr:DUF2523 family protein [Azonexus sp. R2A61]